MSIKYTKDGKKVKVLGKLNDTTWIVQEIFVNESGQELPAGENFTEKTLLDEPAETWQDRHNKELKEREAKIEAEIERLEKKRGIVKREVDVSALVNRFTEKYQNIDISELDTLFAFMTGQITHVVKENYGDYEIISVIDALKKIDNHRHWPSFEGLKLVSLFGCCERGCRYEKGKDDWSCSLSYGINEYRDGSGSWTKIYPCISYKEAVLLLDDLITEKEANHNLIELKEKHSLKNPTNKKIKAYRNNCIKSKKEQIKSVEKKLLERKKELQELQDV